MITSSWRNRAGMTLLAGLTAAPALAQEPINAFDSATQPGPGTFILKEQLRYSRLEDSQRRGGAEIDQLALNSTLNVGLFRDWSLSLRAPLDQRWQERRPAGGNEHSFGVGDVTTLLKWRFWREDRGALDTARLALVVGAEIPTGQSEFSNGGFDPLIGLAYTQIAGRHGFNANVAWTFTTEGDERPLLAGEGRADLLRYDAAYLFRIHPAAYDASTQGAWYVVAELNGLYETNGDHDVFLAPGLMYEAKTWVFEASVQLPVVRELDDRAKTDVAITIGVRFLF
ncbi:MAG: hypothetical protein AB7Q17_15385 [Phycisphaerae bacterium]